MMDRERGRCGEKDEKKSTFWKRPERERENEREKVQERESERIQERKRV